MIWFTFGEVVLKKFMKMNLEIGIKKRDRFSGTSSELIANIINKEKNSNIEHLIIITDGKDSKSNIDKSGKKMKEYHIHFKYVSNYIIGSDGNRIVGAPYCKVDPNVT